MADSSHGGRGMTGPAKESVRAVFIDDNMRAAEDAVSPRKNNWQVEA